MSQSNTAAAASFEPSTFDNDDALAPLPLPSLDDTAQRYIATVSPLVEPDELREIHAAVEELTRQSGLGRRLHAALAERAAERGNWLADWWDDVAYLASPEPVLINSNFGISADARTPEVDQATRAAEVTMRTLAFHLALLDETLPPETVGRAETPLDMSLFRRMLSTVREPGLERDRFTTYARADSRHIVVMRQGRFYALDVLGERGPIVSERGLAEAFQRLIDTPAPDAPPPPIAALTAERRPVWALERARLLRDPINRASLKEIERAIFIVCLDDARYDDFNATARAGIHGAPGQRWMDKTYAYVVDAAGRVSLHGEHGPADGMQFITILDHGAGKGPRLPMSAAETRDEPPAPRALEWRLAPETLAAIDAAEAFFLARTGDLDIEVLAFEEFGKDRIKTFGTGPDPFVQMAFQLAYRRLHGRTPKTYESAQTRMFQRGRTETIRTASPESLAFTTAMLSEAATDEERVAAMRAAFAEHAKRGKDAAAGQGVDRHLLGLGLIADELGLERPSVLDQPIWSRGWELSTAQLPMTANLVNGFGPVCPDGYGIGYVITGGRVAAHVSSWRSDPETSSARFAAEIAQAMRYMAALLDAAD